MDIVSQNGMARHEMRALALEAGFSEAGVVSLPHAEEARDAGRFAEWIGAGRAISNVRLRMGGW